MVALTASDLDRPMHLAWVRPRRESGALIVALGGHFVLAAAVALDETLGKLASDGARRIVFDLTAVERLDTAGAWLVLRTARRFAGAGATVERRGVHPDFEPLLLTIETDCHNPPVTHPNTNGFGALLEKIGRSVVKLGLQSTELLGFFGMVCAEAVATLLRPRRLRIVALFTQLEETGLNALPILGLLTFLIGIVFAYQGADQLRRFGAEIFTVNLLGISICRELGGLMAAIIVAGRSGSAFTAQIGTMKVNEEVDALETLGLNTVEVLVLPRLAGLIITLPLLTFFANIMALAGGAVMVYFGLGITIPAFLRQLNQSLIGWSFFIGLMKAPVFAFIIAIVGCYEGLRVSRDAASVGRATTLSVVESIFLVIVADALFSIMFSMLGI
ncbi:MAG TPA: MlaE family lipid ABC transporter permease subunit [Stellaceae bacterium]|nr:MlaE family lipid ABC transporter permease subunit [Stellaceae bacterium]